MAKRSKKAKVVKTSRKRARSPRRRGRVRVAEHRLSIGPIRRAIKAWLAEARSSRPGDPDCAEALAAVTKADTLIPECFSDPDGRENEVPCPPEQ